MSKKGFAGKVCFPQQGAMWDTLRCPASFRRYHFLVSELLNIARYPIVGNNLRPSGYEPDGKSMILAVSSGILDSSLSAIRLRSS